MKLVWICRNQVSWFHICPPLVNRLHTDKSYHDNSFTDSKTGRCTFLPPKEREEDILSFRDRILATPRDIEDIVLLGKEIHVCPYYATRRGVKQAEVSGYGTRKSSGTARGGNLTDVGDLEAWLACNVAV